MIAPSFRYTTRLSITGETDPQLPTRVLGIVTALNRLPLEFHYTLDGISLCRIEMLVDGGDEAFLRRLATQARKIPSVINASGAIRADFNGAATGTAGAFGRLP